MSYRWANGLLAKCNTPHVVSTRNILPEVSIKSPRGERASEPSEGAEVPYGRKALLYANPVEEHCK